MATFKRAVLSDDKTEVASSILQTNLVNLIDFALQAKEAHWCVVGKNFRSVHEQLDDIIDDVRDASDEVAERLSAIGVAPDGNAGTVSKKSALEDYPPKFDSAAETVTLVAERLHQITDHLREGFTKLADVDPVSEDLLIGIGATLEKHLWMLQAQEL